ncbi:MAG: hypothetical protein IJW77_09675 [Clostridia bacterium]|nr:hypothetical protein [Clostridia bacterium]
MRYVGKWVFYSIGAVTDSDEMVYLSTEDFLKSPMPYIDETDEEAVANELRERKTMIGMQIEICEDGKLYMLMPLPEDATKEEIDAAVASGEIHLRGGMIAGGPESWEERDGVLWYTTDLSEDGWTKGSDEDGFVCFMTVRFVKAE